MNKYIKTHHVLKKQSGTALINTLIFSMILTTVGVALVSMVMMGFRFTSNKRISAEAQTIAEGGIDKAIWSLNNQPGYSGESNNNLGNGYFNVNINDESADTKVVTSTGYVGNISKTVRVKVVTSSSSTSVAFHYGVQVGSLGITMSNNASVLGNIYAQGTLSAGNGAYVKGDVIMSGATGRIDGLKIYDPDNTTFKGYKAKAHNISRSDIYGDAYYQSISGTTVRGTSYPDSPDQPDQNLPISQSTINDWEAMAESGGTINGDYTLTNFATASLGPKKINGNLNISNGATLNLTGVLWVTGNINFSNLAIIKLDPSYGANSGMIIADSPTDKINYGKVNVSNNVNIQGSGNPKSYIMVLSTNTGPTIGNPAINVANNSTAVVYYTTTGFIEVSNNAHIKAVSGGGLHLSNGAQIQYDTGLADASFSTGPGGSWQIKPGSWEKF